MSPDPRAPEGLSAFKLQVSGVAPDKGPEPLKSFVERQTLTPPKGALPDNCAAPAQSLKSVDRGFVTCAIAIDLLRPEGRVGSRPDAEGAVVSMPEAAVDKDHRAWTGEHQVRRAGQGAIM